MRKVIYVVTHGDKWKVQCDHCNSVITDTQVEAINQAKQHVGNLLAGTLSEIRVQGTDSKWRIEWTYGKDPYPPRG